VFCFHRTEGLVAHRAYSWPECVRKRFKNTTNSEHDQPIAPNVLERNFEADAPNQHWVGDTNEMRTSSGGKFYLAAIIDLFSRFCVGWAVSAVNDRHLTMRALEAAIRRRCPSAGSCITATKARRTRPRTTETCSTRTASCAA